VVVKKEDEMNSRNLGKFTISFQKIQDNPETIAEVFSILKIVPVRAEALFAFDTIQYTAIGERFSEVPRGQCAPFYLLQITQDKTGRVELVEVIKK
jgi:hypothetical protein